MLGKLGVKRAYVLGQCLFCFPFHFFFSFSFPFLSFPFLSLFPFSFFLLVSFSLFLFPILNCPLASESYPSHAPCPTAATCPTNKCRVLLPENFNSKVSDVAGQKDCCSPTDCPCAIKLSNEESAVSNCSEILNSLSDVAVQEVYGSPSTCPRAGTSKIIIRYSISVDALFFLGVPRGLLPTFVFLQWRA